MDLYAKKPCLIQIAAQPDPRIQMWHGRICPSLFWCWHDPAAFAAPWAVRRIQSLLWRRYGVKRAYRIFRFLLRRIEKRAYCNDIIIADRFFSLKLFLQIIFCRQITSFWLMYSSNSRRLTSFFVPTNKTKGQLGRAEHTGGHRHFEADGDGEDVAHGNVSFRGA